MSILVTGGLGFIGSHTVVELLCQQRPNKVVIVDNLSNSYTDVVDKIVECVISDDGTDPSDRLIFEQGDLCDMEFLDDIFARYDFDGVIHFAGLKAVNESVRLPLKYYRTNLVSTLNLLEVMEKHSVHNLIFSSSATVYGDSQPPLKEDDETGHGITNPYGDTKHMIEVFLQRLGKTQSKWNLTALRYFNPIGAHPSGLIGESPRDVPNNLMPWILRASKRGVKGDAHAEARLTVYGNDYDTVDGTCVRDYIHVVDVAMAHIVAMRRWDSDEPAFSVYNLGTGRGTSVLGLIVQFEKATGVEIDWRFGPRREGDLSECYCVPDKMERDFGWRAEKTVADMCIDSNRFYEHHIKKQQTVDNREES